MSDYKRISETHQAAATLDDVYAMEDVFKNVFLRFLRAPELAHLAGTSKRFRRDALADTLWAPLLQNMLEQTHGHAGSNTFSEACLIVGEQPCVKEGVESGSFNFNAPRI